MSSFLKILLFIGVIGLAGGALIFGIYLRRASENTSTGTVSDVSEPATVTNANSSAPTGKKIAPPNANTNTATTGNVNEAKEGEPIVVPKKQCEDIAIAGKWSLTTDIPGATFTPPYANSAHTFDFSADGTANFTEVYNDGETTATAQHKGSWTKEDCSFKYQGTASGSGNDKEVGPFSFTFKITASGEVSPSDTAMKGNWLSIESYVSEEGTTQQTITGEWVAKKL